MKLPQQHALQEILNNSTTLRSLVNQAKLLEKLNRVVQTLLPSNLRDHCQLVNLQRNQAIIATPSASWATLLRYQVADLLTGLRPLAPNIVSIKIIIQVPPKAQTKEELITREISLETAQNLQSCAAGIKHEKLKEALLKLSQT